uniref:Uncharacterized protein n=1 Tax=Romanomermis culicivorax TaxID=13658 RepID=A0A915KYA4_ROMCU
MDESTPIEPASMDSKTMTTDQILTDILQESIVYQSTPMDVVPIEPTTTMPAMVPTVDLQIYLATPAVLPGPPIIATVATARYTTQWDALAAALATYHYPPPRPSMLFPDHHWMNYPAVLKEEIQCILFPPTTLTAPVPQVTQTAP